VPTGANAFAGAAGGNNSLAGPNGIMTLIDPPNTPVQLFVGDGPTPVCGGNCSTVKVFTAAGGLPNPTHTISTGGSARADELCWAPPNPTGAGTIGSVRPNGVVMIANDADTPINPPYLPCGL
jgi:hypothetical protein